MGNVGVIARYDSSGNIDTSFGDNGYSINSQVGPIVGFDFDTLGRIVTVSKFYDTVTKKQRYKIARFWP